MIIECSRCQAKVDAKIIGELDTFDEEYGAPVKLAFVECPSCKWGLLGSSEYVQVSDDKWEWDNLYRLWPEEENPISRDIPNIARHSLMEAKRCYRAGAYTACAVMCGRSLEGLCKHHDGRIRNLHTGLKSLKKDGVIDTRLYNWGEALRKHRNLGAHATNEKVSKEDARDLVDFALAICEYVFVLNDRFRRFQERTSK